MKLGQIALSWYDFIAATPETKQLMAFRLSICDTCEHKAEMNTFGKIIMSMINSEASTYYCGNCKCPLAAKTANPDNACPLGKWRSSRIN